MPFSHVLFSPLEAGGGLKINGDLSTIRPWKSGWPPHISKRCHAGAAKLCSLHEKACWFGNVPPEYTPQHTDMIRSAPQTFLLSVHVLFSPPGPCHRRPKIRRACALFRCTADQTQTEISVYRMRCVRIWVYFTFPPVVDFSVSKT